MIINFYKLPNIRKNWGYFLTFGLMLMILGILAISFANWATEFTMILLGILLVGSGLVMMITSFYTIKWSGFSISLLLGLFYLIVGAFCILKPIQSALAISLVIAAFLLVSGTFRLITALQHRFDHWQWIVVNGIISILLGILIAAEWPISGLWVIGLFVGIDLILMGSYWVGLSLAAKR